MDQIAGDSVFVDAGMQTPLVAICIPTYKRPQYLRGLLESLRAIESDGFRAHLIVVDNDLEGTASDIIEHARSGFPMQISYLIEPTKGIATVRNRLVAEAHRLSADYVAFIDDDQLPAPNWPGALVQLAISHSADAVAGRWVPKFECDVPKWAKMSGYWNRPSLPTGALVRNFGTGNVVVRLASMLSFPGPFDEQCNLTGGEDTLFFRAFHEQGFVSIWYDEPLVQERITGSRSTARWMINRGYRVGYGHGSSVRATNRTAYWKVVRFMRSAALVGKSAAILPFDLPFGRARIVPRLANIARGVGGLMGLANIGSIYKEYNRVHGR